MQTPLPEVGSCTDSLPPGQGTSSPEMGGNKQIRRKAVYSSASVSPSSEEAMTGSRQRSRIVLGKGRGRGAGRNRDEGDAGANRCCSVYKQLENYAAGQASSSHSRDRGQEEDGLDLISHEKAFSAPGLLQAWAATTVYTFIRHWFIQWCFLQPYCMQKTALASPQQCAVFSELFHTHLGVEKADDASQ